MKRKPYHTKCALCNGSGATDSGGVDPQGHAVYIGLSCPDCDGTGEVLDLAAISNRIQWLQNTRDYAEAEYAAKLTAEIERLLDVIGPKRRQIRFPAEG